MIFSSESVAGARKAVTKFSAKVTAEYVATVAPGAILRCSFKGNAGGRGSRTTGGMDPVTEFAKAAARTAGLTHENNEYVLDFAAFKKSPLELIVTAESEASVIQDRMDTLDLDKLLLVRSPRRLYVGRVNVTKTGDERKLDAAREQIRARCVEAMALGLIAAVDVVDVILLQTTKKKDATFHLGSLDTEKQTFAFSKYPP